MKIDRKGFYYDLNNKSLFKFSQSLLAKLNFYKFESA